MDTKLYKLVIMNNAGTKQNPYYNPVTLYVKPNRLEKAIADISKRGLNMIVSLDEDNCHV